MRSWSEAEMPKTQSKSEVYQEYCHLKRAVYPYWQSIFHYKEWVDDSDENKTRNAERLKMTILNALENMPTYKKYKFEKIENIKKILMRVFPFGKFYSNDILVIHKEDTQDSMMKQEIPLLKAKFHQMLIVVDTFHNSKKIRIIVSLVISYPLFRSRKITMLNQANS